MNRIETPVLIVGAGPVGATMALDLAWRGIRCTVIDAGDGSVDHPRLGLVLTRTLEFWRRWGIADRIYNCGFPKDYKLDVVYCTSLAGHLLSRDEYPASQDTSRPAESPEGTQRCPQIWFNPLVVKAASEYEAVQIHQHWRLESFEQTGDGVIANTTDVKTGEKVEISASFLLGCDGSASDVRRLLGIQMQGNPLLSYSVNICLRAPEVLRMHDKGSAERYLFIGPSGTWANMTVVDGRDLWRATLIGNEKHMDLEKLDVRKELNRAFGRDDIPYDIISVKPWRRTELVADRFRDGRVFLVGDAAHTMSPTGGFGATTGFADAIDLSWKLEAVLNGWGGPRLLDSYESERRPIAFRAAKASAQNFRSWISAQECARILDDTPDGEDTRRKVGQHMLEACRSEWQSLGVQLGYRYEGSPICVADDTPPTPDHPAQYIQTSRAGSRAPHAWLKDGRSTLDLFGRGFVLLRFDRHVITDSIIRAAEARGVPIVTVDIDDPEIARLYERKLVLVRPDGHTAWRANQAPPQPESVIDVVRGAGKQTTKVVKDSSLVHN